MWWHLSLTQSVSVNPNVSFICTSCCTDEHDYHQKDCVSWLSLLGLLSVWRLLLTEAVGYLACGLSATNDCSSNRICLTSAMLVHAATHLMWCIYVCVCVWVEGGHRSTKQYWNLSSYHHLKPGTSPSCREKSRNREDDSNITSTRKWCFRHTALAQNNHQPPE